MKQTLCIIPVCWPRRECRFTMLAANAEKFVNAAYANQAQNMRFNEPGTVKVRVAGQTGGQELTINIHSGS